MKYLKPYSKLFESVDLEEIKEKEDILKDMSLPLRDDDFNVQIYFMKDVWFDKTETNENVINVNILGRSDFWFDDIKDTILEMIDFMGGEENCSVSIPHKYVNRLSPAVIVNGCLFPERSLIPPFKDKRTKIDYKISNIILRFKV